MRWWACVVGALFVVGCGDDRVEPAPFTAHGNADDDATPSSKTSTKKKPQVVTTTDPTSPIPVKTLTLSCDGVSTPDIDVTAAATGTLTAASGGAIEDGIWILETAERESADTTTGDVLEQHHGMIRFSGNQFAWLDESACMKGTFAADGSTLTFTTTDGTAQVTYTAEADGGFTLKRSADEAYHYAKQ